MSVISERALQAIGGFALVRVVALAGPSLLTAAANAAPFVELQTTVGQIVLELHPEQAPETVANFLAYVDDGFYAGTVVHRVIPGFVVQGGGYDAALQFRATREPIANEAASCLRNRRGTVAMARSIAPRSTTSQFFINLTDNNHLNHVRPQAGYEGYCAFATVVEGMDVADRMSQVATGARGTFPADVPLEPVIIDAARRTEAPVKTATDTPKPATRSTMGKRSPDRRNLP